MLNGFSRVILLVTRLYSKMVGIYHTTTLYYAVMLCLYAMLGLGVE